MVFHSRGTSRVGDRFGSDEDSFVEADSFVERGPRADPTAAVFVLPNITNHQQGPVAAWVSTAGWADAARRVLGNAWIATSTGLVGADEARRQGSLPALATVSERSWRRRIPTVAKTAVKDAREWYRARQFRVEPRGPWHDQDLAFVWQRHELFHTAGLELARELRVPSVLFAPAMLVWQSNEWGVRRPGWANRLERVGEQRILRRADLVACGTDVVADHARRLGVDDDRIIITPTGVDLDRFSGRTDPEHARRRLGLAGRFVVGWVGSFRRFHALEQAVDAVARIEGATLLMVGDGPERAQVEALARERGIAAVFTGTVPHAELPEHLAAMDVCLVLASPGRAFHYSPLKLAEYLAAGRAVVAPRVAQLADRLTDGVDAILVEPGDVQELATAIEALRRDPDGRRRLGAAARAAAEARWSWDHDVRMVVDALHAL